MLIWDDNSVNIYFLEMKLHHTGYSQAVLVNMGIVLIASILFVSISGPVASAYIVPQAASGLEGDGDERIEILRRSGANGDGMEDALKYLEELDKYYAQVARPRYVSFRALIPV